MADVVDYSGNPPRRRHLFRYAAMGSAVAIALMVFGMVLMPSYGSPAYGTPYHTVYKAGFSALNYPVFVVIEYLGQHGWIFSQQDPIPVFVALGIYWGVAGALIGLCLSLLCYRRYSRRCGQTA